MPMSRRKRRAYPRDLTHGQWAVIEPMIPEAAPGGRPRRVPKREIVEAILHLLRAGRSWRLLPHDFPPWQTVYHHLRRWEREGVWTRVHHALVMADRERAGREASPSAAVINSQTVRTANQ
jgi:transposase